MDTSGDVYGQGQYGDKLKGVSTAVGMTNPYVGIAQLLVGLASQNYNGMERADETNKQIAGQGSNINAQHSSPFGVADKMGAEMMPGAEKMLAVNWKPMPVAEGFSVKAPTNVDTSQPPYDSTAFSAYLDSLYKMRGY